MTISDTGTTTCERLSNIIQITVDAAPAANLTASINGVNLTAAATATICAGEEVTFIATAVLTVRMSSLSTAVRFVRVPTAMCIPLRV